MVALLVGIGIGAGGSAADKANEPKSTAGTSVSDLDQREQDLADEASKLDELEADLKAREDKVSAAERAAKANTIDGDGIYEVGVDIKAGRYKNPDASEACYWSINADSNGANIISNHNGGGPQTITVTKGQYLELSNSCGSWKRLD